MALVQLTGGNFQDSMGNVLNNGYLMLTLSHDEQDPGTGTQIAAGLPVKVFLDDLGSVAGIQKAWATDVLLPAGAYYIVEAFRADGTMAWDSPQFETVPSGSSFNVGTWIPNQPVPQPPQQNITLQTNGTNNGSQILENLVAGSNITLTNVGGNTTITAASGGTSFSGNGAILYGPFLQNPLIGNVTNPIVSGANQVRITKVVLPFSITLSKCTFTINSGGGGSGAGVSFGFYAHNGNTLLVNSGVQTVNANQVFTLSFTGVTLPAGVYYYAQTCTSTALQTWGEPNSSMASISLTQLNTNDVWYGTAANSSTAGALPATLGALTADSSAGTSAGVSIAQWE